MKNLILPTQTNNYLPRLLSRKFIILYTLFLILFNLSFTTLLPIRAHAEVSAQSILDLHNKERVNRELTPLTLNTKLNSSAKAKAEAMLKTDCWDHYCPEGKSPWTFFDEAGYSYIYAGENLAEGFKDSNSVFTAWMNSKTHRENILRADFDEVGIAIVYGNFQGIENNNIIVVHFGSRTTNPTDQTASNNSKNTANDSTIEILEPKDNSLLNNNTPEINGAVEGDPGEIVIESDDQNYGEILSSGGIFTFRIPENQALKDGDHIITAVIKDTGASDFVNIQIDTIAPILSEPTLGSQDIDNPEIISIEIEASADTSIIETNVPAITFDRTNDTLWRAQTNSGIIADLQKLVITAFDEAGNKNEEAFTLKDIKGALQENSGSDISISNELFTSHNLRRTVNIAFILFILLLMAIDYYVLSQIDLNQTFIRRQTNHHISIFLLLLVISIAGGSAGEILDGGFV